MKHKGLISIFRTFSKDELELFGRFINAPYHRNERVLRSYFQTFKEFYPDFESENLNDRFIFGRIHPEKVFEEKHADQLIRMLSSELTHLAEKFLFHINIIKDPLEHKLKLAAEASQRGLNKLAVKNIDSALGEMSKGNFDDHSYGRLEKVYKLKQEYNYRITDSHAYIDSLDKGSENLMYYIMSKASQLIQTLNTEEYDSNIDVSSNKLMKFFRSINYDALLEEPGILSGENMLHRMYLLLLKMLTGKVDDALFNEFQKLYKYNMKVLGQNEKYNLYLVSMSLCGKLKCSSDGNYMCACFDMHKEILREKAYKPCDSVYMSERVYRAIILAASLEKNTLFAEEFIRDHTDELAPESRTTLFNFAKANVSFCLGNYNDAIKYLSKSTNGLLQLKYDVKCLLLKIYYELNYTQEFNYVHDSFRQFLKNNSTVSEPKRSKYMNFINSACELMKHKEQRAARHLRSLTSKLNSTGEVAHKVWLIEKAAELMKNKE